MRHYMRSHLPIAAAAAAALLIPLGASLEVARREAAAREQDYVAGIAGRALTQTERTGDQLAAGAKAFNALPSAASCSDEGLSLLRKIDLGSTLLQAAGHVTSANVMDCSSVGDLNAVALGPPQIVTPTGVRMWTDVKMLGDSRQYLAVAQGSFVGIVHKALALEFVDPVPGLAVAAFNRSTRKPIFERGALDKRWLSTDKASAVYSRRGDYVVVALNSKRYDVGAVAAMSRPYLASITDQETKTVVSFGALAGALLAALVIVIARARMSMPAMIRAALRAREFHLVYQPVVDLSTGQTIGAEALIRWRRPDGSIIPPDHFIGIAEQAGVIRLITKRVLELLGGDVREVLRLAPDFHFAVNFSAADILADEFPNSLAHFCRSAGLPAGQLVVEATECSFIDATRATKVLRSIRGDGVQVAIDDFGTGYSNLGYLARLEVDLLKIDKLFIDEVGTGSAGCEVAERVISMAKALNLKIVAEGVETATQGSRLVQLGVDFAQGYHFARPLTLDDLLQRLRAERRPRLVSSKAAA